MTIRLQVETKLLEIKDQNPAQMIAEIGVVETTIVGELIGIIVGLRTTDVITKIDREADPETITIVIETDVMTNIELSKGNGAKKRSRRAEDS